MSPATSEADYCVTYKVALAGSNLFTTNNPCVTLEPTGHQSPYSSTAVKQFSAENRSAFYADENHAK